MQAPEDDPATAARARIDALTADVERSKRADRVASRMGCAVVLAVVFGFVGYALRRGGYDLSLVVLAFVLGPLLERSVRQALSISDGDLAIFVGSPIAMGFAAISVMLLIAGLWPRRIAPNP